MWQAFSREPRTSIKSGNGRHSSAPSPNFLQKEETSYLTSPPHQSSHLPSPILSSDYHLDLVHPEPHSSASTSYQAFPDPRVLKKIQKPTQHEITNRCAPFGLLAVLSPSALCFPEDSMSTHSSGSPNFVPMLQKDLRNDEYDLQQCEYLKNWRRGPEVWLKDRLTESVAVRTINFALIEERKALAALKHARDHRINTEIAGVVDIPPPSTAPISRLGPSPRCRNHHDARSSEVRATKPFLYQLKPSTYALNVAAVSRCAASARRSSSSISFPPLGRPGVTLGHRRVQDLHIIVEPNIGYIIFL